MKKQITTLALLLAVIFSFGQSRVEPIYFQNTPARATTPDVIYKAPYKQIEKNYDLEIEILLEQQKQANKKKEETTAKMQQIKAYYNSFENYPKIIPDGWYKVYSMDNYDFCEERTVYVSDNRITKYFIDSRTQRWVSHSHTITNAKTTIQTRNDDGTTGSILDIYFIDYLNNY